MIVTDFIICSGSSEFKTKFMQACQCLSNSLVQNIVARWYNTWKRPWILFTFQSSGKELGLIMADVIKMHE